MRILISGNEVASMDAESRADWEALEGVEVLPPQPLPFELYAANHRFSQMLLDQGDDS